MMPWLRKGGDCRSPFHKLKIIEKRKKLFFLLFTERTTSCSLPVLITDQKCPADGLCSLRWAGSPKPAEVLVRKTQLRPLGQHCSNQLLPEISSWSTCLSCSNAGWQKESQAVSRRDLHSATQQNFLCRWGYHVGQFLDKCLDVVGVSSQKIKLLFSCLETGLLGGYCSFPKET